MNILIKFKTLSFYKFFLLYFIKPVYEFIWQYIINFQGKILYFLWFVKKRQFINLENNDKKFINDNEKFKILANKIYNYCSSNIIETSKKELLSGEVIKGNPTNSGKVKYNQVIFDRLTPELQKEIFELAHSELLITTAAKYLKVFPILDKLIVYHNIPNKPDQVRGAMLWHKDDFGYKSLDLFMAITDMDEQNGPLKVIKSKNKLGVFSKSNEENKQENKMGERGKISTDHFEKLNSKNILSLKGEKGTGLLIDSFTVYHRGGHCLTKDRLMLRFSYQTPDSIRVPPFKTSYSEEFNKLKKSFSLNFFLNYLYEKRPSKFMIFIRNFLIKFYRFAHIKEN